MKIVPERLSLASSVRISLRQLSDGLDEDCVRCVFLRLKKT